MLFMRLHQPLIAPSFTHSLTHSLTHFQTRACLASHSAYALLCTQSVHKTGMHFLGQHKATLQACIRHAFAADLTADAAASTPQHACCMLRRLQHTLQFDLFQVLLQVAKVGVHSSHLLGIQAKSRGWLMQECNRAQVDMSHVQRLIPLLMGHLQGLAPGQYLLTHQPGSDAVSCFTAQISATQDEPVCTTHKNCCVMKSIWESFYSQ